MPATKIRRAEFPQVLTNWDDTPRQGNRGTVVAGAGSDLLREILLMLFDRSNHAAGAKACFSQIVERMGRGQLRRTDTVHGCYFANDSRCPCGWT